jgi:hypothetical protein
MVGKFPRQVASTSNCSSEGVSLLSRSASPRGARIPQLSLRFAHHQEATNCHRGADSVCTLSSQAGGNIPKCCLGWGAPYPLPSPASSGIGLAREHVREPCEWWVFLWVGAVRPTFSSRVWTNICSCCVSIHCSTAMGRATC